MSHPLPLHKQLIEEAKRQAGSEFRLLPFGLKTLQPIVAARQQPRISFSLLQEAYQCSVHPGPQSAVSTPHATCAATFGSPQGSPASSTPTSSQCMAVTPGGRVPFPQGSPAQNIRDRCAP